MKKLFILIILHTSTYAASAQCSTSGTKVENQKGVKKVAIFINGQNDCCADRMGEVQSYFREELDAQVFIIPWDSNRFLIEGKCREPSLEVLSVGVRPDLFVNHVNGFIKQLDNYIGSLPDDVEIFLFAHSLGANATMQYLNSIKTDSKKLIKFVGIFDAVGYAGFSATHIFTAISDIALNEKTFKTQPIYQTSRLTVPTRVENFYNVFQRYLPFPHDLKRNAKYTMKSESTYDIQYMREYERKKDAEIARTPCWKNWEIGYSSKGFDWSECTGDGFKTPPFSRSCGHATIHADVPEICLEDGHRRKIMEHSDLPGDDFTQEEIINVLKTLQPSTRKIILSYGRSSDMLSYTARNIKLGIGELIAPKLGTIIVNKNTIQYIPKKPYRSGNDFFKLRLEDPEKRFQVRDVLITVNIKPNLPPIAYTTTVKTRWNSKTIFDPNDPTGIDRIKNLDVSAGYDPEGHLLDIQLTSAPQHGKISVSGDHLIYTPEDEFKGSDQVKYTLVDEFGLKSNGTLSINVVVPVSNLQTRPSGTGQGSGTIVSEPGGVSAKGYDFPTGTFVTLTAIPDKNSIFREWDGAGCSKFGDDPECKLFMDTAKQVFPIFDLAPASYNLTINKTGNGKGLVESEMSGISCGEECSADYEYGQNVRVSLHATPDINSTFLSWSGDCSGKESCIQYMSADYKVTANFAVKNPKTFTVTTLDDNGSGTLRQAIVDSNLNPGKDTIAFAKSLKGTITLDNGEMKVTDAVSVEGPGAKQIAISGNNNSRVFHLDPGDKLLIGIAGITIKDGFDKDENGGGAIIINTGDITIHEVHFSKNSADNVGGGGAIRKSGQATLTIQNSAFTDCSALSVDDEGEGGAIRIDSGSGSTSIINTTISSNRAANGGGLSVASNASLTLINSTVTNNTAFYSGGGLYNTGESILGNNIISGNTAPENNEIYSFEIDSSGVLKSLGHNIFGENETSGITADINISDNDIILSDSIQTVIHSLSDNGGETPTHMPVDNGPAINAGNDNLYTSSIVTDQRGEGYFRFMGNTIDIGSVEKFVPFVMTSKFSLLVGETVQLPIYQGHPVMAYFDNIDIAYGYIIPDSGDVFIVGEAEGNSTLLLGDTQGYVSKILIEILELGSKPSISLETKITGLYVAFFNRAADQEGLSYWTNKGKTVQMRGENASNVLKELSAGFATHPTFISTYAHLGNKAFVEAIYKNSLGRDGDGEGIVYWTGKIDHGMSRSDMVATFVELSLVTELSKENYPNLTDEELAVAQIRQDLISNKAEVAQVFTTQLDTLSNVSDNQNPEGDPAYQASIKILSGVTYEERTKICALGFLKEFANNNDTEGIENINSMEVSCGNTPFEKGSI